MTQTAQELYAEIKQRLAEIRRTAEDGTTPGPWTQDYNRVYAKGKLVLRCDGDRVPVEEDRANAALISASRTLLPALCGALETAADALMEMADARSIWVNDPIVTAALAAILAKLKEVTK